MPLTQPTVGPSLGDILRVQSHEAQDMILSWDSKRYVVPANGSGFVPFEAVKLYFGDPRSTDRIQSVRDENGVVQFIPDRPTEIRRLRTLYGEIGGNEEECTVGPHVEVFTLDNQQIRTVLDDPHGEDVTPASQSVASQNEMWAIIKRQADHIEFLLSQLPPETAGTRTPMDEALMDQPKSLMAQDGDEIIDPSNPPIADDLPPEDA